MMRDERMDVWVGLAFLSGIAVGGILTAVFGALL